MKDYSEWKTMEVIAEYAPLKGKKRVKAIYVTEENVKELEELTQAFTRFSDDRQVLLTGFMSLTRFPTWMININPRSKKKKFIFESRIERLLKEVAE